MIKTSACWRWADSQVNFKLQFWKWTALISGFSLLGWFLTSSLLSQTIRVNFPVWLTHWILTSHFCIARMIVFRYFLSYFLLFRQSSALIWSFFISLDILELISSFKISIFGNINSVKFLKSLQKSNNILRPSQPLWTLKWSPSYPWVTILSNFENYRLNQPTKK